MYQVAEHRLRRFLNDGREHLLRAGGIGLEKETLRVSPDGTISQDPHPAVLGSALTNPYITTDYSEAMLEFITPPFGRAGDSLEFLRAIHQFVYANIGEEYLWATSMPCLIRGDAGVPIANYGSSNVGMMKTVYRRGLGHRYGRTMQVIAGVHFNHSFSEEFWEAYRAYERRTDVSLTEFANERYFGALRNLQRFGWLIPYLFGASPAVCRSFVGDQATTLQPFDDYTYYEPHATSLRMGDIGYQNNKENEFGIKACYDSLDDYVNSLVCATDTPCPEYDKIGVKVDGEYRQLNANILQIENEYYSTVRPKQVLKDMEKPVHALKRRGVAYVELRSLDVNAYDPVGISEEQMRFLEAFMAFCTLHTSPPINSRERAEIDENEMAAAHRGREPGLVLMRNGREQTLRNWAAELLTAMSGICEALDTTKEGTPYSDALARQVAAVDDPDLTPSARMLAEMRERGEPFHVFARRKSLEHRDTFLGLPPDPERAQMFARAAADSLASQAAIEAADPTSFDDFLAGYFAQQL